MRTLCTAALAFVLPLASLANAQGPAEDVRLLRAAGVPTESAELIAWIKQLCPSSESRARAEALIRQLGAENFDERAKASEALLRLGPSVLPVVRKAIGSSDPEIRTRARKCVRLLEQKAPSPAVVVAAVRRLETVARANSALVLLDLFVAFSEEAPLPAASIALTRELRPLADQARESLVVVLRRSDKGVEAVRGVLGDRLPARRCAAAIALSLAGVKDALPAIRALLKDGDRGVRLGAAWALALRKEKAAIPVLIALVDQADVYAALAEEVLSELADDQAPAPGAGNSREAFRKRQSQWQSWWDQNRNRAEVLERFARQEAKNFVERFATPAKDVTTGYRSLVYEETLRGSKAEVRGGRLILNGDHDEGDQRLALTALKMTRKAQWPDALDITVKLGGTSDNNIGWHVGVSIGRVKILFHPSFSEGAFRAETVDTHEYIFNNENMGFTPAADVLHPMTIRVRRSERGYRFEVALEDAKGTGTYRKVFTVSNEQMGRFDRIGLERSGRRGGNALFEQLSIRLGR